MTKFCAALAMAAAFLTFAVAGGSALVPPSDAKWDVTVRSEEPVTSARASVTVSARPVDSDDGDSGSNLLVRGVVVVAAALVAGGGYLLVRRRR